MENLKQRAIDMAQTIWKTLFWKLDIFEVMSWGITRRQAVVYNKMLGLELQVNGMIHKGSVIICYDEGWDEFVVYLLDKKKNVVKTFEHVGAEELGGIIDENIEKPKGMKDSTYRSRTITEIL